jgi:polar amino acid transport system substrate-binding protein
MTILGWGGAWADERKLTVGVEELDYTPAYAVKNGEYVGAARDIFDAFAAAKGYTLVYKPLPIKRLYAELLSGGIDLKFPDSPNWAADLKKGRALAYSKPVINYIDGVLVLPENAGKSADSVHVLGTVSGFTPAAWLDRVKAGRVALKENPRLDLLLKQVAMGRFDGAYTSVAVANYALDSVLGTPGALVFDPRLPHSRDAYQISSMAHPQVIAEFDAWMVANAAQVKAIKERHGAEKGLD